ncbi:MAG TPA: hypothetical protein VNQ77_08770 [Frankiaceae bacterium]|nr:hypothetical protein [Frankiaceae bacterium]
MTAYRQLRALVALRWRMVRSPRARRGLAALASLIPLALVGVLAGAQLAPESVRLDAGIIAPTVYLGFLLLSVVSPLTAGGGNELYPADQLVAYPIRPETHYLTGLAVLPINLAWISQLVVLAAGTAFFLPRSWGALYAVPTVVAYVVFAAALGQAGSWLVAGVRQTSAGRAWLWGIAAVVGGAVVLGVRTGRTVDVLEASPTVSVVTAMGQASNGGPVGRWAGTTALLAVLAALSVLAGRWACAWSLRRPGDAGASSEGRAVRVRGARRTAFRELLAVDRAGVWRSASLRRGAVVLGLLPGLVTFALGVQWSTLLLLPGLVASGAVLLFGVNTFCLDGGGAVWLATLPHDPRLALRAKAWAVTETTLVCVALAVGAGLLRVRGEVTTADVVGLACAVVASVVSVVGTSLRLSVLRPHRADLRGRRDTPAPPGTMAVYSVRMAAQTTLTGLLVTGATATGLWEAPVLVALPIVLLGLRSAAYAARLWRDPRWRAYVTVTVAAG